MISRVRLVCLRLGSQPPPPPSHGGGGGWFLIIVIIDVCDLVNWYLDLDVFWFSRSVIGMVLVCVFSRIG